MKNITKADYNSFCGRETILAFINYISTQRETESKDLISFPKTEV